MVDAESEETLNSILKKRYDEISREVRGYKEQLNAVIFSCGMLELAIIDSIDSQAKRLSSSKLKNWNEREYIPISSKLIALRFADIIDESFFNNITILFKIRNKFAHDIFLSLSIFSFAKREFESLKKITLKNDFLNNLPNDSIKFELIAIYFAHKLVPEMTKIPSV